MSSINYALAMTSICDTKENFDRLLQALKEIDEKLEKEKVKIVKEIEKTRKIEIKLPKKEIGILDAINNENIEFLDYNKLEGRISKEYIWVYPPGIPLITPGEEISIETIDKIKEFLQAGIEIRTTNNKFPKIEIIK